MNCRMGVVSLILFMGCQQSLHTVKLPKKDLHTAEKILSTRIGKVLPGAVIDKTFQFTNTFKEDLRYLGTSKSCTCTKLEVNQEIIKPGETCTISATVDTKGKASIPFTVKGNVLWMLTKSKKPWSVQVQVTGECIKAIEMTTTQVLFSSQDMVDNISKQVKITSNIPVDWDSFTPVFTENIQVTHQQINDGVIMTLTPRMLKDQEILSETGGFIVKSTGEHPIDITTKLPIQAKQKVGLQIIPQIVMCKLIHDEQGDISFFINDEHLDITDVISVTCSAGDISWEAKRQKNFVRIFGTLDKPHVGRFYIDLKTATDNKHIPLIITR